MKILKSTKEPAQLTGIKGGFNKMGESMKANKKTWAIVAGALILIVGAVWLNVALFADNDVADTYNPSGSAGATVTESLKESNTQTDPEESYFAMATVNRTQAYDSAYETLLSVTTSATATEEAKNGAYEKISAMAKDKQIESNIETLIKAKGFEECIAVISDNYVDVIVKSSGLLPNEVAQIQEIVLKQAEVEPSNVTIIERTK